MDQQIETRFNKVDDAIQKLASVAGDISRLMAVHEQRINQGEKSMETMFSSIQKDRDITEKRRDSYDAKFADIYATIERQESKIVEVISKEIKTLGASNDSRHSFLTEKIGKMEKMIWMACGASMVIGYLFSIVLHWQSLPAAIINHIN